MFFTMRLCAALAPVVVACLLLECPLAASQPHCSVPNPKFTVSVNGTSKSVSVIVEPGGNVNVRAKYRNNSNYNFKPQLMESSESRRSAILRVKYILPCLCVEVYVKVGCRRSIKCPRFNLTASGVSDVWSTTKVNVLFRSLTMIYWCPAAEIEMLTFLCWKHGDYCTDVFNLSLVEKVSGQKREYNTSAVDKHPQMCVRRTMLDSHNVTCHFEADMSTWKVDANLRRQSIFVYINSTVPAKFSAQLCKMNQNTCASMGNIESINKRDKTAVFRLPVVLVEDRPCVQVWQSEPILHGRRILCPQYTRGRYGIHAVVALVCAIAVIALGKCIYHMVQKDTAGWLCIQRPVLLVCSSENAAHISTVCALANILQKDLGASVHLALWAQSSRSQYGTGVADVGPLPWLYGQWESVIEAQGHVLIVWSLDAMIAYKKMCSNDECVKSLSQKELIPQSPHKIKDTALKSKYKLKKAEQSAPRTEPCTVIAPVFKAALTCLMGALQAKKTQQVAFVCLHGHNSRRDIPKAFRAVPCYCLPRQLSGLLQELGVRTRLSENSKLHCWTGLQSKVLCFWLAQQLARRLQMFLPSKST